MDFGSLIVALALVSGAHADDHVEDASTALDEALAEFEVSGDARSCLSSRSIDEIDPIDDENWLVTTRGRGTFLNTVSRGCSDAGGPFTYLQYTVRGGQLCQGDIVRVIDSSSRFSRGSCSLGEYQLLTPVE